MLRIISKSSHAMPHLCSMDAIVRKVQHHCKCPRNYSVIDIGTINGLFNCQQDLHAGVNHASCTTRHLANVTA